DKKQSLKPDFLLYSSESEAIIIVELKNIVGPSRQAGTELSAYACETRTYMPFLTENDICNVIISPCWPTLLKHCIFNEIFWGQKNIICLEPVRYEGDIRLSIKDIGDFSMVNTGMKISGKHVAGYQLCLYDNELYGQNKNRERLDKFIPQMKSSLAVMSQEGNRQKGHGFAFLWKDHLSISLAPYSITICNISAFKSIERFLHNTEWYEDTNGMQKRFIELLQNHAPSGHGDSLLKINRTGQRFLKSVCNPQSEGYLDWEDLHELMKGRAEFIAFQGWGVFGGLFNELLIKAYENGATDTSRMCPTLGFQVINEIIDPDYNFIHSHWLEAPYDD
ncbi:hypothetical protein, partial [Yersinia mollaretii]